MNKFSLIITAGGTSSRYGNKNKLLEIINGKTIIEHTVEKFNNSFDHHCFPLASYSLLDSFSFARLNFQIIISKDLMVMY